VIIQNFAPERNLFDHARMSARLSDYDYDLPRELIAQRPLRRREDSRMMVLRRVGQTIEHRQFRELKTFLEPGDLLVEAAGRPVTSVDDLWEALDGVPADGTFEVKVVRGTEERTAVVGLGGAGATGEA